MPLFFYWILLALRLPTLLSLRLGLTFPRRPRRSCNNNGINADAETSPSTPDPVTCLQLTDSDADVGASANEHTAPPITDESAFSETVATQARRPHSDLQPSRLSPLARAKLCALLLFFATTLVEIGAQLLPDGGIGKQGRSSLDLALAALLVPALEAITAVRTYRRCTCIVYS